MASVTVLRRTGSRGSDVAGRVREGFSGEVRMEDGERARVTMSKRLAEQTQDLEKRDVPPKKWQRLCAAGT